MSWISRHAAVVERERRAETRVVGAMEDEQPDEARDQRGHVNERVVEVQRAHHERGAEDGALERGLAREVKEALRVPHPAAVRERPVHVAERHPARVLPDRIQAEHERGLACECARAPHRAVVVTADRRGHRSRASRRRPPPSASRATRVRLPLVRSPCHLARGGLERALADLLHQDELLNLAATGQRVLVRRVPEPRHLV